MMNATPGFPCSEYHCSILPSRYRSTVSRTSSGRTANTCDCSKPGLMVPMARILVVGVVFIAAPCAFAEFKPTRHPISANAAAETNFMSFPLCVSLRRPDEPVGRASPASQPDSNGNRLFLDGKDNRIRACAGCSCGALDGGLSIDRQRRLFGHKPSLSQRVPEISGTLCCGSPTE